MPGIEPYKVVPCSILARHARLTDDAGRPLARMVAPEVVAELAAAPALRAALEDVAFLLSSMGASCDLDGYHAVEVGKSLASVHAALALCEIDHRELLARLPPVPPVIAEEAL